LLFLNRKFLCTAGTQSALESDLFSPSSFILYLIMYSFHTQKNQQNGRACSLNAWETKIIFLFRFSLPFSIVLFCYALCFLF
jgi:hypothetical protein